MTKKIITILIICSAFMLNACQKNVDVFVPDSGQTNGPDTAWVSSITATMPVASLQTTLVFQPVRDSFELPATGSTPITYLAPDAQLIFPPHCFVTANGTVVTGKVYIDVQVIKRKGDMVLLNKPTISNGNMLISAGELFIRVMQNGQELQLAPNARYTIRYVDLPIITGTKLFFGDESSAPRFNWLPNTSSIDTLVAGTQVYEITCTHLHWVQPAYPVDISSVASSVISAKLPTNYTNANTTAFLVLKDYRTVLGMYGELSARTFNSSKVINGKAATVVVISKQANDYYLGKENITTGVNATANVQSVNVTPIKTSLADIRAFLANL
ncbi:MAG: hypothetical protein JST86_09800 [Bacteroidetes bacterium]|nr:hypothetical protein [Bacteroidota bacterium]